MPEGPEITYLSVLLKKKLESYNFKEIISYTKNPPSIPKFNEKIHPIINIDSKGKLLWFVITDNKINYYLHIHFGLTGWIVFNKPDSNIKFEFIFENKNLDNLLYFYIEDKRRLSKINFYTEKEHLKIINKLGIDIFSDQFTYNNFINIIKKKNTILASFLLKQDLICGIGNYIKNEVLYLGKLNVKIKTNELKDEQIKKLYYDILFVAYSNLIEMLKKSKINKFLNIEKKTFMPKILEIPYEYKIYEKDFTSDGKKIFKINVGGRNTYCIKEQC